MLLKSALAQRTLWVPKLIELVLVVDHDLSVSCNRTAHDLPSSLLFLSFNLFFFFYFSFSCFLFVFVSFFFFFGFRVNFFFYFLFIYYYRCYYYILLIETNYRTDKSWSLIYYFIFSRFNYQEGNSEIIKNKIEERLNKSKLVLFFFSLSRKVSRTCVWM